MNLTLVGKQHVCGNIWSFVFAPDKPLTWRAGQFIRVELPHRQPDAEGTKRFFTISSAPHEGVVQIATRITDSSFKQALAALTVGEGLVLLDLPAGDFYWRQSPHPLIFVAQGIGITPFYSMLKDRIHQQQPLQAALFFSNYSDDIPFGTELGAWTRQHELQLTLSNQPFTAAALAALVPELKSSTVFVSGPGSLNELLRRPYGLSPGQLKEDYFPNYAAAAY